jgi:hypothetical protein
MAGIDQYATVQCFTLREMPRPIETLFIPHGKLTLSNGFSVINNLVNNLFTSLQEDILPAKSLEGVFGIQVNAGPEIFHGKTAIPMGALMFKVWKELWKNQRENIPELKMQIAMAVLQGKLPEWIQLEVLQLATSDCAPENNICCTHLFERGFENIKFDVLLFRLKWGEITESDLKLLRQQQQSPSSK